MKLIALNSKSDKKLFTKIDDEDCNKILNFKLHLKKNNKNTFYVAASGNVNGKYRVISLHRLLLNLSDPRILVDHKDHDGLNNQKSNLRLCNCSLNNANTVKIKNISGKSTSSKFKGVSYYKQTKRWESNIYFKNKKHHIGFFNSEIIAAIAYNKKAIELFGEFAYLNKIELANIKVA